MHSTGRGWPNTQHVYKREGEKLGGGGGKGGGDLWRDEGVWPSSKPLGW